ncbi:hypothetical protein SK128_015900 [Halocaridina rubra]|uniref:Uncharacterized protein n=1 Tax=Halocaridina rubra TaxID=373956 RepID=A0AAN8WMT2_HALRR
MEPTPPSEIHRHFSITLVDPEGNEQDLTVLTTDAPESQLPVQGEAERSNSALSPNAPTSSESATGTSYSTFKNIRRMTRDALPRLDHYRNMSSLIKRSGNCTQRPTIDDLLQPSVDKQVLDGNEETHAEVKATGPKFGWIKGVLFRCLLNIWGVILFLRISWVTAQCGILEATGIAIVSTIVTGVTTLSMSAIGTNGQIKGGGTYFMISRSLGPEFGGATGIIFSFANAINSSLNIVGFCESLNALITSYGTKVFDGSLNDIRLYSVITLAFLLCICVVGMEWEARAQMILLVILLVAILDFVIGVFVGPLNDEVKAKGFVGINGTVFMNNLYSDYRTDNATGTKQNIFTVFSVYFPACTGVLAGSSISGDLKDPVGGIPKGTLLGILLTSFSYILFIWLCGAAAVKDATGNVTQLADWSFLNCTDIQCNYGLMNSPQVMEDMSLFGPLIFSGMSAASISTALSSLALCNDNLYPFIGFFGKGTAKSDEPVRGYVLSAVIVIVFNLLARLDAIAPIITNFFLATFALINFACFHASMQNLPSWRPTFKYYNAWLSLFGGVLCTAIMFLIEWWTALLTWVLSVLFYIIVKYRKPDVNWGSSAQAQTYTAALHSVSTLSNVEEHVKTYRPQILVLSGAPNSRPPLIHFANAITKNKSLLVAGQCIPEVISKKLRTNITKESMDWLSRHKIKAFYSLSDGLPMDKAARVLMINSGLGRLQPNMVMLGYKANWHTCSFDELEQYFKTIQNAFEMHLAVTVLRVEGGLDYSYVIEAIHREPTANGSASPITERNTSQAPDSPGEVHGISFQHSTSFPNFEERTPDLASGKKKKNPEYRTATGELVPTHEIDNMLRFTRKQPKGTIDVWWLFDDGGLTLLIPYILTTRSYWSQCSLRIFFLANKDDDLPTEQRRMAELLCKFRIEFSDVVMISDITQQPRDQSIKDFNNIISKFQEQPGDANEGKGIKESELQALQEKTNRHIRLRELLLKHSRHSSLVVMTLPVPTLGRVSPPLYLAWLETLTKDMPPFLLVRGNQTSVLTFYT